MFFLKKLVSFWVLPPGIFIISFLVMAVFSGKNRKLYILGVSSALSMYLLSIEPVKDLLYKPLEEAYPVPGSFSADVIVVLGGGAYGSGVLKEDSVKRLLTAYLLQRKTGLPMILSGGASISSMPEAEAMKALLTELKADTRRVYTETESRDTEENALYVKEMCDRLGYKKILLVTSAYHMKRAVRDFQKQGLEVIPYPTDFKRETRYNLYSLLPKMTVLADSYKALREYLALISDVLR